MLCFTENTVNKTCQSIIYIVSISSEKSHLSHMEIFTRASLFPFHDIQKPKSGISYLPPPSFWPKPLTEVFRPHPVFLTDWLTCWQECWYWLAHSEQNLIFAKSRPWHDWPDLTGTNLSKLIWDLLRPYILAFTDLSMIKTSGVIQARIWTISK